jgi:hypothetical protein
VFSPEYTPGSNFLGIPVQSLTSLQPNEFDRIIFGDLDSSTSQKMYQLEKELDETQVVVFFRKQPPGRAR